MAFPPFPVTIKTFPSCLASAAEKVAIPEVKVPPATGAAITAVLLVVSVI